MRIKLDRQDDRMLFIVPHFIWYDFWVGFYYSVKTERLYICPLPMLCLEVWYRREPVFGATK